jgi:quinoprotein glucose dehydrogenase
VRKGTNLFANSVIALDATTGERKWHYQTVRHDIWDYDNPPAPILVTIRNGATSRDAVVQLTKMGFTFVLDRETGQPLFPVQEVAVPPYDCPWGRGVPKSVDPAQTAASGSSIVVGSGPDEHFPGVARVCVEAIPSVSLRLYQYPTKSPGNDHDAGHLGGAEWHGASFDPVLNVLYVNVNEVPTINRLRPVHDAEGEALNPAQLGQRIFERTCAACHGVNRQGTPTQGAAPGGGQGHH